MLSISLSLRRNSHVIATLAGVISRGASRPLACKLPLAWVKLPISGTLLRPVDNTMTATMPITFALTFAIYLAVPAAVWFSARIGTLAVVD